MGHASFLIKSKDISIVTDPFDPQKVGFPFPKIEVDIVTISHDHSDHNNLVGVSGSPKAILGPGEYEIKGAVIFGIESDHDAKGGKERGQNTIYLFELEDLKLAHLGDLGRKLNAGEVEALGDVDVLFIPVGGVYTIDAETAAEVVTQLEPKIVIPMHYQTPDLKLSKDLETVESFLEEMGAKDVRREKKFKVAKSSLPDETQVIVLERV